MENGDRRRYEGPTENGRRYLRDNALLLSYLFAQLALEIIDSRLGTNVIGLWGTVEVGGM